MARHVPLYSYRSPKQLRFGALSDLENKLYLDEAATRAQVSQGEVVAKATPPFDAAYGELVKGCRRILGDGTTWVILPRFIRKNRVQGSVAGTAQQPAPAADPAISGAPSDLAPSDPASSGSTRGVA